MRLRNLTIILIVFSTGVLIYYGNRWLQKMMQPRRSFRRLMAYLLICFILAFVCSFLVVLFITKLFPLEKR